MREADAHEKEKLRLTAIAEDLQKCAEISRAEGLIAMEEAVPSMEGGSRFLSFAVSYINYLFMKQMDLERTFEFLDNYVATLPEAERTEGSMVAGALKLIYAGERAEIIQEYIASCIGMEYREKEGGMNKVLKHSREEILNLYRDKTIHSEATGLMECFSAVGDYEIQTLLRKLDSGTLAAALAGASGGVVQKFLSNTSDRIQYAISQDIQNFTGSEEEIIEAQRRVLECNF